MFKWLAILALALSGCATNSGPYNPYPTLPPVERYLETARHELGRVVASADLSLTLVGRTDASEPEYIAKVRPLFETARAAAAEPVLPTLEAHWALWNRCMSQGTIDDRQGRERLKACESELVEARVKVELAL